MVNTFKQGDIVTVDFDPQSGHEQKGKRPAIVVSNNLFNKMSSLTMVCPITNTDKNHPFHVKLNGCVNTTGVIMCDQVRMIDLSSRNAVLKEQAPSELVAEAVDIISGFIEII